MRSTHSSKFDHFSSFSIGHTFLSLLSIVFMLKISFFFPVHVSHHQTGIGAADDGWKGGLKSSHDTRSREKKEQGVGASRCQKISVGCSTNFCAVLGFPPARRLFYYKFFFLTSGGVSEDCPSHRRQWSRRVKGEQQRRRKFHGRL